MFFQKQLVILALPFIAGVACALFWTLSFLRDKIDPPSKRWDRKMKKHTKRRAKQARKLQKKNDKKLKRIRKKREKADEKINKELLKDNKVVSFNTYGGLLKRAQSAKTQNASKLNATKVQPMSQEGKTKADAINIGDETKVGDITVGETESTRTEETTVEDTKVEDTKVEETNVEDTKVEETNVEDTKVEETNVEDTKVEETIVEEETKVEDTNVEDTNVEDTKVEEIKVTETTTEQTTVGPIVEQQQTKVVVDTATLMQTLAVTFYQRISSEKKVNRFLQKLDKDNKESLSKTNLLPLIQSLLKSKKLTVDNEEFLQVWNHLTTVCAQTERAIFPAMIKWWKTGAPTSVNSSSSSSSSSSNNSNNSSSSSDATPLLQDTKDNENALENNYQNATALTRIKSERKETHKGRHERLQQEFEHLVYDPLFDHQNHVHEMQSKIEDNVLVFDFMVQPLLPLGIVWKPTKGGSQKKLEGRHSTQIKRIRKKSQAGQAGLQNDDVLASMNGKEIVNMTFSEVKELFRYIIDIGETYQLTFFRKVHKFKSSVHSSVRDVAMANKDDITTWDKFIATMVSVIYLLYPTVTRGTFTIVACQRVGSRMYLQMDLDIQCWEETHIFWVLHLFLPCVFLYVIGLPLVSYLILRKRKYDLMNRFTRFRYGVLYTGYTDDCYYWEVVIATRKAAVVGISVFLTGAGAQAQALCAMMVIIFALTAHLLWRPYVPVTEEHNTLFWSEFWGLQTAFVTFWTGLFFFQEVAQDPMVQAIFTVEVLTANFVFVIMALRWYMILKLMDLEDMVSTKKLQGFDEEDLMVRMVAVVVVVVVFVPCFFLLLFCC